MAIIQEADDIAAAADGTAIIVFGSEPAVGSLIVLLAQMRNTAGTFSFPASFNVDFSFDGTNRRFNVASKVYAGEGNSFTVTRSDTTSDFYLGGYELTADSEFDQSDSSTATAETVAVGPVTTSHDDSALITGIMFSGNITAASLAIGDSFNISGNGNVRGDHASKDEVTAGSYGGTWSWTTSRTADAILVTYGVPAAGGISIPVVQHHRQRNF